MQDEVAIYNRNKYAVGCICVVGMYAAFLLFAYYTGVLTWLTAATATTVSALPVIYILFRVTNRIHDLLDAIHEKENTFVLHKHDLNDIELRCGLLELPDVPRSFQEQPGVPLGSDAQ